MIVLTVGPRKDPVTGQSKCFNYFVENTKHETINIFSTGVGKFYFIKYILLVFYHRLFSNYDAIYFTSSRSKLGFLRDLILVLINNSDDKLIVNHLHGADFKRFYESASAFYKVIVDFVYTKIDISIVLCNGMKSQYSNYKNMKLEVVSNFYDQQEVGSFREYNKRKPLEILFLSNLIKSKGYKELVDAVKTVNRIEKDCCILHLAGAAFDEDSRKFIFEIESNKHVMYHGVISGKDKSDLLSRAHILALPTYYPTEAQPLCLIEGMASGCYIVTTNHNYIPEFVSEVNGSVLNIHHAPIDDSFNSSLTQVLLSLVKGEDNLLEKMNYNITYSKSEFSSIVYINKIDMILEGK